MGYAIRTKLAAVVFCAFATASVAGDAVLTVSGDLVASETTSVQYSVEDLQAFGRVTFSTTTPWTEGVQTFEGVPVSRLLDDLALKSGVLEATAVNDYAVSIPVADALQDGPIIAYLRNGAPMSVRDKGPLWIVYPYDSDASFRTELVYSRSIWQLDRIVVKD